MTLIPPGGRRRRPSEQEAISLELVSGLLMIIGFVAFALLFYAVVTNDGIREATQGPEVSGVGLNVEQETPVATIETNTHFVLNVSDEMSEGVQDGDILLKVGDAAVDAESMTEQEVVDMLTAALANAATAGDQTVAAEVYRDGETVAAAVPVPAEGEEAIVSVLLVPAQDLSPYFRLRPIPGGPADSVGVRAGDRLVSIDGVPATPAEMTLVEVRDRLLEKDVSREDDDFEITIEFLREQSDGRFTQETRTLAKNVAPSLAIAYLNSFGFVIPLLIVALGWMFIRLGTRLRKYDLVAARWALVAFMWLAIAVVIAAVWSFWVNGKGGIVTKEPFNYGRAFSSSIPLLIIIIPLVTAYKWLGRVIDDLFEGEESLTSRNTRFAWTLLVPTLAILLLVAARPLEQTFLKSLTDDEFGRDRPARFVGLDNYVNLISFKFATVECREDDTGACARTKDGSIIWERSSTEQSEIDKVRELSPDERRNYVRYQEAFTWGLFSEENGLRMLGKDPLFLKSFANTLRFTVSSVVLELILGLVIALVVNSSFRGRGLMRTAMLVPWAIPTVVSAVLWQTMLRSDQTGIFNKLLMDLNIISQPNQWFATTGPWMNAIIAVDVWKTAPFMALLLLAGLQTIPGDIYEAASVDGAGKVRQFFMITLPLLRPTIAVALIFRTLDALRAFDVFQVLLDSTRPSMAAYNYNQLVLNRQDGYASAVGVMIFIIILIFTVLYVRFVGIERE